ncbi:hypothetical protein [Pseudomonas amygdali]|uniref:Holin n=2 Tax=Pseudomonas amygdali pv. lachrymans TaxID=53707 RepID=A0ABR5KTF4_PSEAV|nr:hypothetical protein [Pseudomonas amygdali]AXH59698.1 hypothetical protein PLA107_031235 [Pseudomonas amygdali pv. lachrymans str. M301315]KPC17120.1 Uncharacterized protein AC499_0322 [Pseudomonas amygdali pv. lachrymans]KPC18079.1 Uncharacterized protein AC499_1281 [Pseudomonas amygdali pv. lachrymans]RMT05945.1 hypothetical protein ALP54_03604 [Pseudomonas amygdali pv. lachrymans]
MAFAKFIFTVLMTSFVLSGIFLLLNGANPVTIELSKLCAVAGAIIGTIVGYFNWKLDKGLKVKVAEEAQFPPFWPGLWASFVDLFVGKPLAGTMADEPPTNEIVDSPKSPPF